MNLFWIDVTSITATLVCFLLQSAARWLFLLLSHQQLGQSPRYHFHPPLLRPPLPPPGPPDTVVRLCLLHICQVSVIRLLKDMKSASAMVGVPFMCLLMFSANRAQIYLSSHPLLVSTTFTTTDQLLRALGSFSHHHRAVTTPDGVWKLPKTRTIHVDKLASFIVFGPKTPLMHS